MKVALLQLNSGDNLGQNLRRAGKSLATAAKSGAQLACLPEMFSWQGNAIDRPQYADDLNQGVFAWLAARAKEHQMYIVGGSHMEKIPNQAKMFNTCCVYAPDSSRRAVYRKQKLFQLAGIHDETISYQAGSEKAVLTINAGYESFYASWLFALICAFLSCFAAPPA